ncbi:sugar ABC transporter permease [Treponema sp. TIM-1]|uniref:carbohydrate ABC transporter permease n=1 Tax=Treponema sp. TIM-1 TaxID=2898417 RepID=UPI00398068B2
MIKHKTLWITLFVLPCALLFSIIYAVPITTVFLTSFTKWTAFIRPSFIGLKNYLELLSPKSDFWPAVRNTLIWVMLQTTVHLGTGLIVALILYRRPAGWKAMRTIYLIPNIIPTAAMGVMFLLLLNPQFGIVKSLFVFLGIGTARIPNLFGNSDYSFVTVTMTWIFYSAFNTTIFIAEIGAIPTEIYESAHTDGAKWWQIDMYITLPLLKNSLKTCVILAAVAMVSHFDVIYVTTKGGPGVSTLNLPILLHKTASLQSNYGLANTIGVFQIIIGIALVVIINLLFRIKKDTLDA